MSDFRGFDSLAGLDRAIAVILVSEIGDKTFLIAAILSMRHPRLIVFAGAITALALMSLLSALLGTILPTLLPKRWTTIAASALFFVFGVKMLKEGIEMEGGREKIEEEMREVQKEVEEAEDGSSLPMSNLEEGRAGVVIDDSEPVRLTNRAKSPMNAARSPIDSVKDGIVNLCHLLFSPIFIQSFVLTFLAEWGDRSQISTIALAAAHNVWIITIGTTMGHAFCTSVAVIAGRWISQHISIKHVTLGGAVLFLVFGVAYAYEGYYWSE